MTICAKFLHFVTCYLKGVIAFAQWKAREFDTTILTCHYQAPDELQPVFRHSPSAGL